MEIPELVLREALANAIAHRDYETPKLKEQPTRVEVYPDRVEVTSFGSLPQEVSVESLNADDEEVGSFRRNPVIASIFQHLGFVELNASGILRMRELMTQSALRLPRFINDVDQSVVRVILERPSEWADENLPLTTTPTSISSRNSIEGRGYPRTRFKTYISSTSLDLPEHRAAVRVACERAGFEPVFLGALPTRHTEAVGISLGMVDDAEVYIGIFAYRYGYVPDGYDISITEMEYNRAVEQGKPQLIFFIHEEHPVTMKDFERGEGAAKLESLKGTY